MRNRLRNLQSMLVVVLVAAAPLANALQFSNVIIFGDSLSDSGYYRPYLLSLGLSSMEVQTLGRMSTNPGRIWAEIVAQRYGSNGAPSNDGGSNFAQGGARIEEDAPALRQGTTQRPVSVQVSEYLSRAGGAADNNALHAIWAGANDVFVNYYRFLGGNISQAEMTANIRAAANAEVNQVARLVSSGARYVMVLSLPDLGALAGFSGAEASIVSAATQLSRDYNRMLFTGLSSERLRVIPVDTFSLLSEVRANPAVYGLVNVNSIACGPFPPYTSTGAAQFCGPSNLVAPNASETFLFADSVHPTSGAHRIFADFATSLIDGPVSYSMLGETALRTRAAHVQTLADGIASSQASGDRRTIFVAVGGGSFRTEARGSDPQFDSDNRSYSIGVSLKATTTLTIGAAVGRTKSEGTFARELGGFRSSENLFSLFVSAKSGGFYFSGAATTARLKFPDSRRVIVLGEAIRVASSSPSGASHSAFLGAGYDFLFGKLSIGPTASLSVMSAIVDAFEETGAESANLRIGSQKRRSEIVSLGVRAAWDLGSLTPYARFTVDRELKNGERLITATPLSMSSMNSYDLPAYRPADSTWTTALVGVRGAMTDWISYGLNYSKVTGRSGLNEDYVTGSLSGKF